MATPVFDNSVFAKFFSESSPEVQAWVDNVMSKLSESGILAKYINKGDLDQSDSDFFQLEEPIVKFYAYLVILARKFEIFKQNDFLSDQYLLNKGHYTSGDETLDELLYSISNLLRQRSRRGTIDTITPSTLTTQSNGEVLSLLAWTPLTFFKLGVARPEKNSWNVDNSSPLYRGMTGRYDMNIGYEYTEDIVDLNKYPVLNPTYVKQTEYRGKNVIEIESVPILQEGGIGLADLSKKIIINPNYNYEISFFVSQDATLENLTFGVKLFDFTDTPINAKSSVTGLNHNFFFQTRRLNKAGKFYFVRGIIFNKDKSPVSVNDAKLNIGFGTNLKFPPEATSLIPYIVMDNNGGNDSDHDSDYLSAASVDFFDSGDSDSISASSDYYDGAASIYLWNIKVTPSSTDYERCYLDNKRFIDIICSNKNGNYNNAQIKDILRKYFIPYNTAFNLVNLPRTIQDLPNLAYLLLEDGGKILEENEGGTLLEQQP